MNAARSRKKAPPLATVRHPTIVPIRELLGSALPRDVPERTGDSIFAVALAASQRTEAPTHGSALRGFLETHLREALVVALGARDGDAVLAHLRRAAMPARTVLAASRDPALPPALRTVLFTEDVLVSIVDGASLVTFARAARDQSARVIVDLRDDGLVFGRALAKITPLLPNARILLWTSEPAGTEHAPDRSRLWVCNSADAMGVARALAADDDAP